jgi:dephospho-CoA kinase
MKAPLIVVTGPIASGKSTVAKVMAEGGGVYVDADMLAHAALEDPGFVEKLGDEFGPEVMGDDGKVSRLRLAGTVFSDQKKLDRLNVLIRPYVKKLAREKLNELAKTSKYIVLDAVLFLQYRFRLKADLVVLTGAPEEVRIRRMMRRNGFDRKEAEQRIERQKDLIVDWEKAGVRLDTDIPLATLRKEAVRIKDEFLEEYKRLRRKD